MSLPDASLPDVEWQGAGGSPLPAGKWVVEQAVEFPLETLCILLLVAGGSGLGCPASYSAGLQQLEQAPSVLQR